MKIIVTPCRLAELRKNAAFPGLWREYATECALDGLPPPDEKMAAYGLIEASGAFQSFGAFLGDLLVGFAAVLAPVIPHYGIAIAVTESLFVGRDHRKTGAGLALIRTAEAHAKAVGSPALLVSAPTGGPLASVLPRIGYHETNRTYMRRLSHD